MRIEEGGAGQCGLIGAPLRLLCSLPAERQGECENTLFAECARGPYLATVIFNDLSRYGKAESRAFDRAGELIGRANREIMVLPAIVT